MTVVIDQKDVNDYGRYCQPLKPWIGAYLSRIQSMKLEDICKELGGEDTWYKDEIRQFSFKDKDFNEMIKLLGMEDKGVKRTRKK